MLSSQWSAPKDDKKSCNHSETEIFFKIIIDLLRLFFMVLTSRCFCNSLQVLFENSSHTHASSVNQVLRVQIINTASCENDIGARSQDLVDTLFSDIRFSLSNSLKNYYHMIP